jgi:protein-disulfide isomerase
MISHHTRLLLTLALAPLALAACKSEPAKPAGEVPKGEIIAAVAPPAGKAWTEVLEETTDGGVRMGNPDAPIKLVEYGSLSCPHCAKLSQDGFPTLMKDYVATGKVNFEYRSFAIHPQDVPLTMLVRCAPKEAFFPLVEQIYTNFDAMNAPYNDKARIDQAQAAMQLPPAQRWSAFSDAVGYSDFFAARGVSKDQGKACLADLGKATLVAEQAKKYGEAGISSTPTLVLNGTQLDMPLGSEPWDILQAALKQAGAR